MLFIAQGKTNLKYILIVVILAAIVGGGILTYQYWRLNNITLQSEGILKIVSQRPECASIDVPGYQVAGGKYSYLNYPGEIRFDINNDGQEELTKVYEEEIGDEFYGRRLPIVFKIFSGPQDCLKEEFSYRGKERSEDYAVPENEVGDLWAYPNFWGDGRNTVTLVGVQTAYGSGFLTNIHFFTYENGKYQEIATLEFHSDDMYKLSGEDGLGKEIIVARMIWAEGECHFCPHRYKFEIYTWDGSRYLKREAGTTKNKYSFDIELIIQAEPDVLNQVDETANWKTYTNSQLGFSIKYPPGWFVYDNEIPPCVGSIGNFVFINKVELTECYLPIELLPVDFYIFEKGTYYPLPQSNEYDTYTPIEIAGEEGVLNIRTEKSEGPRRLDTKIYVHHNNFGYEISFPNVDFKGNHDQTYDRMLSTFLLY